MAKQLNVDLRFNADTSAAKAQLQSLQTSINQLTTSMATQGTQLGITPKIQEAQQAAVQLKTALSQSMNVETGKFDLSKFNSSLKSMNTDLSKLKTQLTNLGPQGQQTFMALAQSIMTAEIPTKRISASLAALGTTLKNTAKWQLSSSMLHGFMSAVQTSYRYAQDLNTSLNSIRIVTGESAEAMDKFAVKANKAAKALSASTLDYTDAALIFYQQGLKGKDVEDRTNVTIKMANVSRQSAEEVSDQLTAIWNNFYDGTQTLESFADKMVALGAATASSSDEIAGGLEKFAAVGQTIGLSYEYAASALATITSNTRQSEEVVGTALKTIFARIQGLKLGETLEDGTELNKYSEALYKVGIDIFDANKQLKDMDTILNETAARWKTLGKDQQAALAQTVAGVRQYTQFIALMDNWDDGTGDSMIANLKTVANSTGALQEQADIYAESWEGANKRVKASAEAVYTDLLDDDFFIKLTNGFADFLELVDKFLDSMGGAKGLLTGLSSILLNIFAGSAAKGLENMVYNFKSFIGLAQKEAIAFQNMTMSIVNSSGASAALANTSQTQLAQNNVMIEQVRLKHELINIENNLNEQEKLVAQAIIEQNEAYGQQLILLGQIVEQNQIKKQSSKEEVMSESFATPEQLREGFQAIDDDLDFSQGIVEELNKIDEQLASGEIRVKTYKKRLDEIAGRVREKDGFASPIADAITEKTYGTNKEIIARTKNKEGVATVNTKIGIMGKDRTYDKNRDNEAFHGVEGKTLRKYIDTAAEEREAVIRSTEAKKEYAKQCKVAASDLQALGNTTRTWSQTVVGVAQSTMSFAFAINSLKSMFTTLGDETISTGDKILQVAMSLGMAIPMVMNAYNGLRSSLLGTNLLMQVQEGLMLKQMATGNGLVLVETILKGAKEGLTAAQQAELIATQLGLSTKEAELFLDKQGNLLSKEAIADKLKEIAAKKLENTETSKGVLAKGLSAAVTWVQKVAQDALNVSLSITNSLMIVIIATIAALAIAVAGVIWIVNSLTDAYNADAIALEQANAHLKEQQEVLKETQAAHEELITTLEKYETAYNALQQMTKGTEEWKKQAEDLNKQVVDLITKYPELAKHVERNADGVLTLSEKGREELKDQSEKKVQDAEIRALQAQRRANEAKQKSDITNFSRKGFDGGDYWNTIGQRTSQGATMGMAMDVMAGGTTLGIGTLSGVLGGLITGLGEAIYNDFASEGIAEDAINDLISGYSANGEAFLSLDTTQTALNNLAAVLGEDKETIIDLIRSNQALEESNRLLIEQEVDKQFEDDEIYQNSKYQDVMREQAANIKEEAVTQADKDAAKDELFGSYGDDYSKYLEAVYGEDAKNYRVVNTGGKNATVQKYNAETKQYETVGEKNGLTQEQAIDAVAQAKANERANARIANELDTAKFEKEAKEYEEKFEERGLSDTAATEIAKAIMGKTEVNFANMNQSDIDQLSSYNGDDIDMQKYAEQARDFEKGGGVLNAVNSSYKDIYAAATEQKDGQFTEQALEAQRTADEIQRVYQTLSDEDKKIFAESVDFKKAKNEELMFQELEIEKEKRAFANLDSEAQKYELDAEVLKTQAGQIKKALQEQNGEMENAAEVAAEIAVKNQRLNKGVDNLTDNWKDWKKALKGTDKTTQDYAKAVEGLNSSVADILNLTEGSNIIPDDFWDNLENINLMDQIANGSEQAVAQLGQNLFKASVESAEWTDDIADNIANAFNITDPEVAEQKFAEIKNNLLTTVSDMQNSLNGLSTGDVLNSDDATKFATNLNEYAKATKMSVEDMQSMLNTLGLKADIKTESQPMEYEVPEYTTFEKTDKKADSEAAEQGLEGKGWSATKTYTVQTGSKKMKGAMTVANIAMGDDPNAPAPQIQKIGSGNIAPSVTSGGKSGGGGSKPKKTSEAKKDKTDIVDRYKEVNDQLAKTQRLMDKNSTLADTLWGPDKIKKIQENTKALEKENKQLDEKIKLQKQYLQEDKGELIKAGSNAGLNFEFGEDGTILNYTTEMTKLYEQREATLAGFGDEMDETEQETLEKLDEKIEAVTSAYETYEETLNEGFEFDQEKLENEIEQMENRFQEIELKIEAQVELNENDIEDIEFQLDRLGEDNVYNSAERIALIEKNAASYKAIADAQIEGMREAERLYQLYLDGDQENGISQSDYMDRLKEGKAAIQDAERSIREGIKQIGEELQNTFDMADEKLDQQYEKFDRITELMDHYKNVVSLTEGEASYKKFNQLLRTQQEVLRDRIAVNESEIAMWEAQEVELRAYRDSLTENSPEWLAADAALNSVIEKQADAKSQMMADIEQLGEYAREIFENSIEQAMIDFEETMFGGTLSSVIESIDMLNAKQEELLTTTNKIYETNKMLRNIEKDIESTTNQRAKQAYNEFAAKVKQKQEQNELTKFELDLLTAEYEITKAQIALEEAKDAKDTVRLTRDAEGNYGYVYTANQDKISEAEQALDDATNNYYNTALEGAQKYQDQIYSHIQEWEEKVKEVMLDQTLSEEEKNAKIKEINDTYNTLITQDKELYYKAIGAMQESAYNTQVDYDLKGIESAEKWFTECDGFIADMKFAQDEYDTNTGEVAIHTQTNFGNMSTSIKNAKKDSEDLKLESQLLANNLNNELIGAVDNAKGAWDEYILRLQEVIRLTDEAMIKTGQEMKNNAFKDDYAQDYIDLIVSGEDPNSDRAKAILSERQEKIRHQNLSGTVKTNEEIKQIALQQRKEIKEYATGGYTGKWGPEGKLAVLHQKELVLNAQDTENFLTATEMLREISQMLDTNALVASLGAINLHAMTIGTPADQVLQQEVTIHADFPNVTDHNEIEIAIDNLINAASQHAYKA